VRANPKDAGEEIPAAYYERHKKHVPTPQELAVGFRNQQREIKWAKKAQKAYLHSKEHHDELMHAANKAAEHARKNNPEEIGPSESNSYRCGSYISASALGYKKDPVMQSVMKAKLKTFFLQTSGGPSMANPGSGAAQVVKDIGRSKLGKVAPAETGKFTEPFYKVFKDGYSLSLCAKDSMYDFSDKYGFNKDQYKATNISIVRYEDVVLKEMQKAMSPKACYEFCRTVPDMVYFGIKGGSHCYCMPFFQKAASGSSSCDSPCPGDPSMMCGGKEKSMIFEMHLCADTHGDLLYSSVNAEEQLVYFYDTAFMTQKFAAHLETIGGELAKVVTGNDPFASDLAQLAIKSAASLNDPKTGWGVCKGDYMKLLDQYEKSETMYKDGDFTFAKELQKAEDAMHFMDHLKVRLNTCAKESEGPILEVYPFYHDIMVSLDEKELQGRVDKAGDEIIGFVPVLYKINPVADGGMSSCEGEPLGRPMPLKLPGCAMACDVMKEPRCAGFQYFQMMDGDVQKPLCFLFHKIKDVRAYRCTSLDLMKGPEEKKGAFIEEKAISRQITTHNSSSSLRGSSATNSNSSKSAHPICAEVARVQRFSGMSCESIWGKESKWVKMCPEQCEKTKGMKNTALCMARDSLAPPLVEPKQIRRCFGSGNAEVDQANADFRIVEFGTDASGGAGPKIEGDIEMGNYVVKEPYGYVWTPGPAGKR